MYQALTVYKEMTRSLFEWLSETFVKRWTPESKLDMPDFSGLNVDEEILRLMEIGVLEWVCSVKLYLPQWKDPEDKSVTNFIKIRGTQAHLKTFLSPFL